MYLLGMLIIAQVALSRHSRAMSARNRPDTRIAVAISDPNTTLGPYLGQGCEEAQMILLSIVSLLPEIMRLGGFAQFNIKY